MVSLKVLLSVITDKHGPGSVITILGHKMNNSVVSTVMVTDMHIAWLQIVSYCARLGSSMRVCLCTYELHVACLWLIDYCVIPDHSITNYDCFIGV